MLDESVGGGGGCGCGCGCGWGWGCGAGEAGVRGCGSDGGEEGARDGARDGKVEERASGWAEAGGEARMGEEEQLAGELHGRVGRSWDHGGGGLIRGW